VPGINVLDLDGESWGKTEKRESKPGKGITGSDFSPSGNAEVRRGKVEVYRRLGEGNVSLVHVTRRMLIVIYSVAAELEGGGKPNKVKVPNQNNGENGQQVWICRAEMTPICANEKVIGKV